MNQISNSAEALDNLNEFLKKQIRDLLNGQSIEPSALFDDEINQLIEKNRQQKYSKSQSEQRYSSLYENAPIAFQSLNDNGEFIDINPAWYATLGYEKSEVIGKKFRDFLHPDWQTHFDKNFPEFKKRGYVSDVEFKIRHKNGNYLHISFEGCIGTHPDGSFKQTYCVFSDITDQKAVEETLRKNQYYLSKAQELGKIGTWELDLENDILIWTKENYKVFGIPFGTKMNYEKFLEIVHPDDRDYVNNEWNLAVNNKVPYDIEHRLLINNETKWVREKADIHYDTNGKPVSAIGFSQDITKFKEVENSIKQEKEKFKILADNTFDWEYWIDPNGNYIYLSPACERITGYKPEDFINNPHLLFDLTIPEYKKQVENHYKKITEKDLHTEEFIINNKNGEEVWIEHTCIPVYNANGTFKGRRGTNKDITARKKAEQEIIHAKEEAEESEAKFRELFSSVNDAIFVYDPDTFKILEANEATSKIYGYSHDELIGMSCFKLSAEVERSKQVAKEIRNKSRVDVNLRHHKKKDGTDVFLHLSTFRISANGENIYYSVCHDITNIKKTETELIQAKEKAEESEKMLRAILENSTDIIALADTKGKILDINKVEESYNKEDVVGTYITDFLNDEDSLEFEKCVKQAIKTGLPQSYYPCIKTPAGKETYWHNKVKAWKTGSNETMLTINFSDISNLKLYERQLVSVTENLKKTFNISPAIICKANLSTGYFVEASMAVERILGYSPEEFISAPIVDFIHQDDIQRTLDEISEQLKGKETISFENRYRCKNGSYKWMSWVGTSADKDGFVTAIGSNIDERKKGENEIIKSKERAEENERKLYEAQEIAHLGSWDWIAATDRVTWSPTLYNLLGRNPEKPAPPYKDQAELYTPTSYKKLNKAVEICLETGKPYEMELEMIREDKTIINVRVQGRTNKDESGNIIGLHGTVLDIDAQKKLENELIKAKEKAEESDRLKSAFLANMSHEIRTPMNGILGFSSLLKESHLSGKQQKHYIEIIQKSGERMLNTVNDIIEISKIETGLVTTFSERVNVNKHLSTLYHFFKFEADKKGLELVIDKQLPEEDCRTLVDKSKFSSILTNLIKNAIKFTYEGSIRFGCVKKKEFLEFYVKDTGVGVPQNRIKAIFNRFEQAEVNDTRVYEGSGLGLTISKSYVEMLGGTIWVESEEGVGSTFFFTIPAIRPKQSNANISRSEKPAFGNTKQLVFLIAEDDEVSKMHLSILLKDIASNIIDVSNGLDAVEAVRNNQHIDIVLMDIRMPKMDGIEAVRSIREFNKDIVIIAQTAFALEGDREKMLQAGCTDYISKPINKQKLIELTSKYS